MKKILAVVLCVMLMGMMSVVAYAADEVETTVEETTVETPVETTVETPVETTVETSVEVLDEIHEDTPIEVPDETIEEPPTDEMPDAQIEAELTTDMIVDYITAHLEEFSVILTMILTVFYQVRKHNSLNKSVGVLNNNAITVAENSSIAINDALGVVRGVADTVVGYKDEMSRLLAEVRANEEEKREMRAKLDAVDTHFKTAKAANIELANEVAELLVLANIPNSKKDELYARHRAAVAAIEAEEAENAEVKEDDGEEA